MKIYCGYLNWIDHFIACEWKMKTLSSASQCNEKRSQIAVWHHPKLNTNNLKWTWLNACKNAHRMQDSHANWVVIHCLALYFFCFALLCTWIIFDRFNERIQQISNKTSFRLKLSCEHFFDHIFAYFFFPLQCTWFLLSSS